MFLGIINVYFDPIQGLKFTEFRLYGIMKLCQIVYVISETKWVLCGGKKKKKITNNQVKYSQMLKCPSFFILWIIELTNIKGLLYLKIGKESLKS